MALMTPPLLVAGIMHQANSWRTVRGSVVSAAQDRFGTAHWDKTHKSRKLIMAESWWPWMAL